MALAGFGKETPGAAGHGIYPESVLGGIPPLPGWFRKRCTPAAGDWKVLNVWRPDVHDLAASKLKRFATKDRDDLRHLCGKGFLQADKLREALESAFLWDLEKDGDPTRERAFANLARVVAFLNGERPDL